jgi:hypothetical protein
MREMPLLVPTFVSAPIRREYRKAVGAFREVEQLPGERIATELLGLLPERDSKAAYHLSHLAEGRRWCFVDRIPKSFAEKAAMQYLGYTSPLALLAEKLHLSPSLLKRLNPGVSFDRAGAEIIVAEVEREQEAQKVTGIAVDADLQRVTADGKDRRRLGVDRPLREGLRHPRHARPRADLQERLARASRVTNCDALRLASHVSKGTEVTSSGRERVGSR